MHLPRVAEIVRKGGGLLGDGRICPPTLLIILWVFLSVGKHRWRHRGSGRLKRGRAVSLLGHTKPLGCYFESLLMYQQKPRVMG